MYLFSRPVTIVGAPEPLFHHLRRGTGIVGKESNASTGHLGAVDRAGEPFLPSSGERTRYAPLA